MTSFSKIALGSLFATCLVFSQGSYAASDCEAKALRPAGKIRANSATQPRFLVFAMAPTLF